MRVILVRHGETIWNEEQRYQGASDPPLSERGELQARRLAARLASESIGLIYSSDSTRALQTADQIAAHHGRQVRADPRLREMDFGDWEGLTYSEIRERYPQALARWQGDPLATSPPGGESLGMCWTISRNLARPRRPSWCLMAGHCECSFAWRSASLLLTIGGFVWILAPCPSFISTERVRYSLFSTTNITCWASAVGAEAITARGKL